MQISPFIIKYQRRFIQGAIGIVVLISVMKFVSYVSTDKQTIEYEPLAISALEILPGLQRTFDSTGEVKANQSANIIAEFPSTVVSIHVREGEKVEKGQKLITLESKSVQESYSTANAFYVTAVQSLSQAQITGKSGVGEAETARKTAQINLEQLLKEDTAKRIQAEETLNAARINLNLSQASAQTTLENAIRKVRTTYKEALTTIEKLLEFTQTQYTTDYTRRHHIGSRDIMQKREAQHAVIDTRNIYATFNETYQSSLAVLNAMEVTLRHMLTMLEQNSTTSTEYTPDDLNNDILSINTHSTDVLSLISELESAKRSLESVLQISGNKSQQLIDAEAAYATTIAGLDAAHQKAILAVEQAERVVESARATANAGTISARSTVTTAGGELEQARISQEDLEVVAPFEGVVVSIPERKGREIQVGDLIIAVENADLLQITAFVSADQVRHLRAGDIVSIDGKVSARITSVSPSADPATKKFKVEIYTRDNFRVGEFVKITFTAGSMDSSDKRIFVPVTAVHVSAAETFVWGLDDSQEESKAYKIPVRIGNVSGKYIEILEGLLDGDLIVTDGGRSIAREGQEIRIRESL